MNRIKTYTNLNRLHLAKVLEARAIYFDKEMANAVSTAEVRTHKQKRGRK